MKYLLLRAIATVSGFFLLIGVVGWPTFAHSDTFSATPCAVSPDLGPPQEVSFPKLLERLRLGQSVLIVAVGGASTHGVGAPDQAYPAQLQVQLTKRYPRNSIQVINFGVAHETAEKMLQRMVHDVLPLKPQLVIWETGTNDAVYGIAVDDFAQSLQEGLALLSLADIDVLLMDMQYSRESAEVIDFGRYINTMQGAAVAGHAHLFQRYAIMEYWSKTGAFEFDAPTAGTKELAAQVYSCIALRLADVIAPPGP